MISNNLYKVRTIVCLGCQETITKRMQEGRNYCSLKCYRSSKRPQRESGKVVKCDQCSKEVYKQKTHLDKSSNFFCSLGCANEFQGRNKLIFNCKTCGTEFKWSKSRIKDNNPKYCTIQCRNNDAEHLAATSLKGNTANLKNTGLNKLEQKGSEILNELGIVFKTQVPMFNKFTVDVLIDDKKLIIQWDGEYWHSSPKRKALDQSQDAYMIKCGYKVLRVTDRQIKENIKQVYDNIRAAI